MKVSIYSRSEIENIIAEGAFPQNTAVISFCDPELKHIDNDYSPVDYSSVTGDVFCCEVDDLDLDYLPEKGYTYDEFFPEATTLADFINQSYRDGKDIICQCEYGQSRSAGCAAAILEHFYRRGIEVFSDYRYYPNQVVYHKVFDALGSSAFQPAEYLNSVYEYSGVKFPFDRHAVEEALSRLTKTERDILYLYLYDGRSMISIAEQYGYSDVRIEQILSKAHRQLAHYIWSIMRR